MEAGNQTLAATSRNIRLLALDRISYNLHDMLLLILLLIFWILLLIRFSSAHEPSAAGVDM